MFRRQQQDQERIRQQNNQQQQRLLQDRLRREEDQRRQQQLLRNLQHTSTIPVGETGGTTVVHVAPGIQVELSGLTLNGNIEFEQAGVEASHYIFGGYFKSLFDLRTGQSATIPAISPSPLSRCASSNI